MNSSKAIFVFLSSLVFLFQFSFLDFGYVLAAEVEYSYNEESGRGPSKWGELKPEWKACREGRWQSPIDLRDQDVKVLPPPAAADLQIQYQPAPATIKSRGHDVQVSWNGNAGKIIVSGVPYNLQHCHWHIPTEHAINGIRYDLELHLVHKSSWGAIAVIGILYKIGEADSFLTKLLPSIKSVKEAETDLGVINPNDTGFWKESYYRLSGSLTSPPCEEGVIWTVFQKVRTASDEQVIALKDGVADGFEMNARPFQPLNGRPVHLFQV